MRITRVKIKGFKNLKDIEFSFEGSNGLAIFVGCNGCGKSNLLEAISYILEDIKGSVRLGSGEFEYELEYVDEAGRKCLARRSSDDEHSKVVCLDDDSPVTTSLSAVGLYNGDYNRLQDEGLGAVEFVTAEDFNAALIVYLLNGNHKFELSGGFICRDRAVSVSYEVDHMLMSGPDPESNDPLDCLVQDLITPEWRGDDNLIKIPFAKFIEVFDNYAQGSLEEQSYLIRSTFARFGSSIRGFSIEFKEGSVSYSSLDLSEGEKKCILLDYALYLAKLENRLVLLDEPDASVHESRKLELLEALKNYADSGNSVLMTTHSPTIINAVDPKILFGLRSLGESGVERISHETLMSIDALTGDRMSVFSKKPILMFEGKSDILLLKRVSQSLRKHNPDYRSLDVDTYFNFYTIGGTGNAVFVYKQFRAAVKNIRILVALDADNDGRAALQKLANNPDGFDSLLDVSSGVPETLAKDAVFTLPRPEGLGTDIWMIEDYLPKSFIQRWIKKKTEKLNCFHVVVDLKSSLKDDIGNATDDTFNADELACFKPLIDHLVRIEKALKNSHNH